MGVGEGAHVTKDKCLGGCEALSARLGIEPACCGSCHDDDEFGIDLCVEHQFPDGYYIICCMMAEHHEVPKS